MVADRIGGGNASLRWAGQFLPATAEANHNGATQSPDIAA